MAAKLAEPTGMQTSKHYLTPMDLIFQHLETKDHPMTCTSIWTFKDDLDDTLVAQEFVNLAEQHPKFRQIIKPLGNFKMPEWVDYEDFKMDDHLHFITLTDGTKEDVAAIGAQRFVSLDVAKPLWRAYVIHGLKGNGSALVVQAHHSLSDGIGFLYCTLSLTSARDIKYSHKKAAVATERKPLTLARGLELLHMFLLQLALILFNLTKLFFWELNQLVQAHIVLRKSLRVNPEKDSFSKAMSWSEPVDLEDVKYLRKHYSCTVNDILTTILTLAIRNYLAEHGLLNDKTFRFLIPISVRKIGDLSLSNRVGGSSLFTPVESSDPAKLLKSIQFNMYCAKNSIEPSATCNVLSNFAYLPSSWYMPICRWYANQYTGVFTNIPGPQQSLKFAGSEIDDYVVYPPQTGPGGLGMGVISYNNKVVISIITDETERTAGLAKGIAHQFKVEFDRILSDCQNVRKEEQIHPLHG
ncbi:hypothetical protein K493DRAFT_339162 [Basidiobolus meristosporus CBS 931.73]|uniref:Uncharacterized protein n=1 Tax=Basidiobolus meristosporus CBS 931.73 TaxID=1314790 RepID=A0A1Y1Y1D8_9FUNG|nr:hypothetical protein K493DRAFT_339162 [Basidiobolus meristosporus CBS 931.73]|eukprot:ORX91788.1 hypothetical protein K493DRAFT_339162 [Basidiobolus meristosporus CBS 931.73]